MIIRSDTLKAYRKRHSMSQADLSRATEGPERVSISSIKRIESANGEYEANPRIAKRLAEVLKVQPEALAKEPRAPEEAERRLRDYGYRPLKAMIDSETALAFQMVEHLYGIPARSQVLMAPLFCALLAEGSFAWRRESLAEIEGAAHTLLSIAGGHLSFAGSLGSVTEGAFREGRSIEARDVFGRQLLDDFMNENFDPQDRNPFADYLQAFAEKSGAKDISFDPDGLGGWKTSEGLPEYRIAPDVVETLTGGDRWAAFALRHGFARIRDIPDHLMGKEESTERIEWLASKVPVEERARHEALIADIDIDL